MSERKGADRDCAEEVAISDSQTRICLALQFLGLLPVMSRTLRTVACGCNDDSEQQILLRKSDAAPKNLPNQQIPLGKILTDPKNQSRCTNVFDMKVR